MSDTTLRDAALALAAAGWEALPCSTQTKAPLIGGGHKNASSVADLINLWWDRWPRALIGVKIPEDVAVLDIDPRNGGNLDDLTVALGPLPDTMTVTSGRGDGGLHLYYSRPVVNLRGKVPGVPGIDVKKSGYMIAPPSPHPESGQPYRANGPFLPVGLPALPERAVAALVVPEWHPGSVQHGADMLTPRRVAALVDTVRMAQPGARNELLLWAACRVYESGAHGADAKEWLDMIALAAYDAGLPQREIEATIRSASKVAGS